jgi:hypothetical protein
MSTIQVVSLTENTWAYRYLNSQNESIGGGVWKYNHEDNLMRNIRHDDPTAHADEFSQNVASREIRVYTFQDRSLESIEQEVVHQHLSKLVRTLSKENSYLKKLVEINKAVPVSPKDALDKIEAKLKPILKLLDDIRPVRNETYYSCSLIRLKQEVPGLTPIVTSIEGEIANFFAIIDRHRTTLMGSNTLDILRVLLTELQSNYSLISEFDNYIMELHTRSKEGANLDPVLLALLSSLHRFKKRHNHVIQGYNNLSAIPISGVSEEVDAAGGKIEEGKIFEFPIKSWDPAQAKYV